MTVAAVIPGYNEEDTIQGVIRETNEQVDEVIYVDDGSTDDTIEVARDSDAHVVQYGENVGKGFALRTGFKVALQRGHDEVVVLDSDGQHDPRYIPRLLDALEDADIVIGSRYEGRFYTIPRNVLGNFGLNFVTNLLSYGPQGYFRGQWITDTQSGLRAFSRKALEKMDLESREYEIESEVVFEAATNNLKIKEIPIKVSVWVKGITVRDGLKNGLWIFKKRFKL